MVGSFTKMNAFIGRRFKTPLGQRETSWDILSQKTSMRRSSMSSQVAADVGRIP